MVFFPPAWVPNLPEIPDTVPIYDFIFDEKHGRRPFADSWDAYTCGISGSTISAIEQKERVPILARSLAQEFGWKVNEGTEFDKVVGVYALNTIDIMTLSWAVQRLNGLTTPANAAYSAEELSHQLVNSRAKVLFTVMPLLQTALAAADKAGIPRNKVYICEMPTDPPVLPKEFKTLGQLQYAGLSLPDVEHIRWRKGQGARQTAFLCYSSGTSGPPKGVMISHRNVIANIVQVTAFDRDDREALEPGYHDVALGLLPQSHIYGLIVISHLSTYNGDRVIVLPKFELDSYFNAIQEYRISTLYIVPPIILAMIKDKKLLRKFDLSSVRVVLTGAAPLGEEIAKDLASQFPSWIVRQGYGLTETSTVVTYTPHSDVWFGSAGVMVPGYEAKLMSPDGIEITEYNKPGELWVKTPSLVLGYFNNDKATEETFVNTPEGRFMRTGDEVEFRVSPKGNEHVWVVDRIKELIKVKGLQVAPAELEACLLELSHVADCAVISIPDERAGEVPKAFVVRAISSANSSKESDEVVRRKIIRHVEKEKARYKWLVGGVEFINAIPKSPSGKILRRILRDREKQSRKKAGSKL